MFLRNNYYDTPKKTGGQVINFSKSSPKQIFISGSPYKTVRETKQGRILINNYWRRHKIILS